MRFILTHSSKTILPAHHCRCRGLYPVKHRLLLFFRIMIIVLITMCYAGCENNEDKLTSPFGPKVIIKEKISFDHKIDAEIKIPKDATGSATSDVDVSVTEFETPVHPEGKVIYLEISEMPIELRDTKLNDGILSTRKYGEIEIFLTGLNQGEAVFELRATQKQILSLKKEIIKYLDNKRALFSAVLDNDIPKLKILINEKVDLNVRSIDNITPLIAATVMDHPEVVRILLDANADVNAKDSMGWTALINFASTNVNSEIGDALIKAHADINAKGKYGTTTLIMAAMKGNMDLVKTLVQADADLNAEVNTPEERFTALGAAEREGHREIEEFLKKSGAK